MKHERRQTTCMVFALLILWTVCICMFCKALDHPAEQPISYAQHMEMIGGDIYGYPQN